MKEIRYKTVDDLDDVLKNVLPDEAQKIYLETYQESWNEYEEWKGGEMGREGVAHRNAMGAVMREYALDEETGKWHKRGKEMEKEGEDENMLDRAINFLEGMMSPTETQTSSKKET